MTNTWALYGCRKCGQVKMLKELAVDMLDPPRCSASHSVRQMDRLPVTFKAESQITPNDMAAASAMTRSLGLRLADSEIRFVADHIAAAREEGRQSCKSK